MGLYTGVTKRWPTSGQYAGVTKRRPMSGPFDLRAHPRHRADQARAVHPTTRPTSTWARRTASLVVSDISDAYARVGGATRGESGSEPRLHTHSPQGVQRFCARSSVCLVCASPLPRSVVRPPTVAQLTLICDEGICVCPLSSVM